MPRLPTYPSTAAIPQDVHAIAMYKIHCTNAMRWLNEAYKRLIDGKQEESDPPWPILYDLMTKYTTSLMNMNAAGVLLAQPQQQQEQQHEEHQQQQRQHSKNESPKPTEPVRALVHWSGQNNRWRLILVVNGKRRQLGSYLLEQEARDAGNKFVAEEMGKIMAERGTATKSSMQEPSLETRTADVTAPAPAPAPAPVPAPAPAPVVSPTNTAPTTRIPPLNAEEKHKEDPDATESEEEEENDDEEEEEEMEDYKKKKKPRRFTKRETTRAFFR